MRQLKVDASDIIISSPESSESFVIDFVLSDEFLVYGGTVIVKNPLFGDYISCEVCFPNGTVYNRYIEKIFLIPINDTYSKVEIISDQPAKVPQGMLLRVTYHPNGLSNRECMVNYRMEQVVYG